MGKRERERIPYFHLSKNEHGKMWIMYKPDVNGRYRCWEPITEEFWSEFEKLLQARNHAIQDCIQALKESGWSEDDYNGKIIFNTLEQLKTKP